MFRKGVSRTFSGTFLHSRPHEGYQSWRPDGQLQVIAQGTETYTKRKSLRKRNQLRNVIKTQKLTSRKRKKNINGNAWHNCTKARNSRCV